MRINTNLNLKHVTEPTNTVQPSHTPGLLMRYCALADCSLVMQVRLWDVCVYVCLSMHVFLCVMAVPDEALPRKQL